MNRNEYKKVLSGVQPSDMTIERIMDMTNTKRTRSLKKGLVGVIIAIAVLACGGLTANAATDGAVAEAIDTGIKQIKVLYNGKEIEVNSSEETYVNDDGKRGKKVEVELPQQGGNVSYDIVYDDEGAEWSKSGDAADEVVIQVEDFNEPTTSVNE